jgi:hypothetical protein
MECAFPYPKVVGEGHYPLFASENLGNLCFIVLGRITMIKFDLCIFWIGFLN